MINFKTLSKRVPTKKEGIFYKSIINDNAKEVDKVYIIRYLENDSDKLKTIGKYSHKLLLMKLRSGEEPPTVTKKKNLQY